MTLRVHLGGGATSATRNADQSRPAVKPGAAESTAVAAARVALQVTRLGGGEMAKLLAHAAARYDAAAQRGIFRELKKRVAAGVVRLTDDAPGQLDAFGRRLGVKR